MLDQSTAHLTSERLAAEIRPAAFRARQDSHST